MNEIKIEEEKNKNAEFHAVGMNIKRYYLVYCETLCTAKVNLGFCTFAVPLSWRHVSNANSLCKSNLQ